MEQTSSTSNLPENAYRELKPGEVYRPVMSPEYKFPEVTRWSVFWGLIMAVLFSAASAYSGLKIGQVMEAAIPISILAVGISSAFKRRKALGQNVIIQSIGASSGVIVAGAIFTIPALYILNLNVSFFHVFLSSLLGGFLGILFLIPFRKYFVRDMHGKFPFPEATATTEILMTGETGGKQASVLIISGLLGGVYDFIITSIGFWTETITSRIIPAGEAVADKIKLVFKLDTLSMILGLGYIVGLKYATIICAGSFLSWFVFVPLINEFGNIIAGVGGTNFFAGMRAEDIFSTYVRHIGIGGIAMAGIIGILKSSKIIGGAFSLAYKEIFHSKKSEDEIEHRTQKDLKITYNVFFILLTVIAIFIFLMAGVHLSVSNAIIALLTVTIIAFLFTTVAANAIAIVGTNPVSGMTLMTLILSSIILTKVGLTGEKGMVSALIIGGIVCTALSMAGGFITDLKIGYWLGSTPVKQQSWKFLGTFVSAASVGAVILLLNQTYGFGPSSPNPLAAPQANAMAAVIEPLMSAEAQVHWTLYLVGAVIAILLNALKISPLAFALGMYLPLELNTPLLVGGLVAYFVKSRSKDEGLNNARFQRGTLIASGFIAGGALFGVFGAIMKYVFGIYKVPDVFEYYKSGWLKTDGAMWLSLGMFILIIVYMAWDSMRAKPENNS
ncbi:MAG: oligopeptide transporter, OPT family [Ignavibacteria bacterium GWB2_35_12]|nr:MAG: oligopeptide transporter, OPT family [Ignavibacteria bacterium GWA2_35_8]OGU41425.1 MAG: oligopeptide transporter, OPT family [Ignavibacteria bacterium GWB2_35_12]OGU95012.1 MAG: oligopeptide transporter, OPT family [Ignavibacteria bacterium RIFOXYA2_FULL_35_10]OGV19399.1 MAG: oligopeptide transporter, OPT family [Ignavibacteria bacterium RIFOXYC2_FULL_35_21]